MSWPTQEQFDTASEQGAEQAREERRNGATAPQESPLSGEWADGKTPRDIAHNVGWMPGDDTHMRDTAYHEGEQELASTWENGYFDAWAHADEDIAPAKSITDIWNANREETS